MIDRVYNYLEPLAAEVESLSRKGVPTRVRVHPTTLKAHPEIVGFARVRHLAVHADEDMPAGAFSVSWDYLN